jgi:alanine racemase
LVGPNNDAHAHQVDCSSNFVVTHIPEGCKGNANFFVVENTTRALQEFAANYRGFLSFPSSDNGSNGKTIVKEWLNFY